MVVQTDTGTKLKQFKSENKLRIVTEFEYILAALQTNLKDFKSTLPVQIGSECFHKTNKQIWTTKIFSKTI